MNEWMDVGATVSLSFDCLSILAQVSKILSPPPFFSRFLLNLLVWYLVGTISLTFEGMLVPIRACRKSIGIFFPTCFVFFLYLKLSVGATISLRLGYVRTWSMLYYTVLLDISLRRVRTRAVCYVFLHHEQFPRHFSHFERCSLWELLILGYWIKNCRRYGPSFVLADATIVDGDAVRYIMP